MVGIEQDERFGILAAELLQDARLPIVGEMLPQRVFLLEKPASVVWNLKKIKHFDHKRKIGHEHPLRQFTRQVVVAFSQAGPETGYGLSQVFAVDFVEPVRTLKESYTE